MDAEGVLLAGAYGVGKSSLCAEVADVLERRGIPEAELDLDGFTSSRGLVGPDGP